MEINFENHFNIPVKEILENKKQRNEFIKKLNYNDFDDINLSLQFFMINIKKIPDEFIHNPIIIRKLINYNVKNVLLLNRIIDNFSDICKEVLSKDGLLLESLFPLVKELPYDTQKDIIMTAVKQNGWVLKFPLSGTSWLEDMEIIYLGIRQKFICNNGSGFRGFIHPLQNENELLLHDYEIIKTMFEYDIESFKIFPREMSRRYEFLDKALNYDSAMIYEVHIEDSLKKEFIIHLIEKSFTGCLLRLVNLHKNVIDKEVLKIIYNSVPECCDD